MGAQLQEEYVTVAEYLEREDSSVTKHEYLHGRIYAMAGGTRAHARIIHNLSSEIHARLKGHPCSGTSSDQRVKIEHSGLITYSDILVSCPPERVDSEDINALLNPVLLGEVFSPSTETYDRTARWDHYRQIPELRDYLLISAAFVRIEHLHLSSEGQWNVWSGNR